MAFRNSTASKDAPPPAVKEQENHRYVDLPDKKGFIRPIPNHKGLFRAVASKIPLPDSALELWNDKEGEDGEKVWGMQHRLHLDLDQIRGKIAKKCKSRLGPEAIVNMPELWMVGSAVGAGSLVKLQTTIWIPCTNNCSRKKVVRYLEKELTWPKTEAELLGWTLEVRVYPSAECFAVECPVPLTNLTLDNPILLRDNTKMYLHIEDSEDNGSSCGRYLCTTFVEEGNNAKQRLSRFGGLINLNGEKLGLATAHSILERFISDLQPPSEVLQSESPQDDELEKSDSQSDYESDYDSDCETDNNGCDCDQGSPYENSECHSDALGYKDPTTISRWKQIKFGGPINFLGLGRDTLTSLPGEQRALQQPPGTDFALFKLIPRMVTAENTYSDPRTYKTLVGSYSQKQDMQGCPVEILVDDERSVHGFLLPQSSGIYVRGIMLETRKIELDRPLARGTSGAWVVQGDRLYGMIIAAYDHEIFAHMIAIEKIFQDVLQSYPSGAKISLPNGTTSLHWAASGGNEAVVRLLINEGANLEAKDKDGRTPLLLAIERGYEDIVQQLLDNGADIESKDDDARTPLSYAAEKGHKNNIKLLFRRGAKIDLMDRSGRTPLSWAASNGHETIVKLLLEMGAKANTYYFDSSRTLLSWAASSGHATIVKLLLEGGAKGDTYDFYSGRTPLSWAASNGHETIVKLLLERGAKIDLMDHSGQTPLSWAASNGHETIVKLLLESDAKIDLIDRFGQTPLFWAASNGHETIVTLLLERGTKTDLTQRHI